MSKEAEEKYGAWLRAERERAVRKELLDAVTPNSSIDYFVAVQLRLKTQSAVCERLLRLCSELMTTRTTSA